MLREDRDLDQRADIYSVGWALAKSAADRFPTMQEFAAVLHRAGAGSAAMN